MLGPQRLRSHVTCRGWTSNPSLEPRGGAELEAGPPGGGVLAEGPQQPPEVERLSGAPTAERRDSHRGAVMLRILLCKLLPLLALLQLLGTAHGIYVSLRWHRAGTLRRWEAGRGR